MKKLKCAFLAAIFFSVLLTGCGKEKETRDLSPQSMMDYAFTSTEDSFFKEWEIDREAARADTVSDGTIYTLNESYERNGQKSQIMVQFEEGKWAGITYRFLFSDEDSYLEEAYRFLYQYDKELNEKYGEPQEVNGTTFLKANETYEDFKKNTGSGETAIDMGDLYEFEEKTISVTLSAGQGNAMVEIRIFPYKYRPINT